MIIQEVVSYQLYLTHDADETPSQEGIIASVSQHWRRKKTVRCSDIKGQKRSIERQRRLRYSCHNDVKYKQDGHKKTAVKNRSSRDEGNVPGQDGPGGKDDMQRCRKERTSAH